jgi:hypothetical protein
LPQQVAKDIHKALQVLDLQTNVAVIGMVLRRRERRAESTLSPFFLAMSGFARSPL